jgi:hypothetical protein
MKGLSQVSHYPEETTIRVDCNQLDSIPNTNPGPPAMVALGHLWYNSDHMSRVRSAPYTQGLTSCQDDQARPALGLTSSSPHILTTSHVRTLTERLLT